MLSTWDLYIWLSDSHIDNNRNILILAKNLEIQQRVLLFEIWHSTAKNKSKSQHLDNIKAEINEQTTFLCFIYCSIRINIVTPRFVDSLYIFLLALSVRGSHPRFSSSTWLCYKGWMEMFLPCNYGTFCGISILMKIRDRRWGRQRAEEDDDESVKVTREEKNYSFYLVKLTALGMFLFGQYMNGRVPP